MLRNVDRVSDNPDLSHHLIEWLPSQTLQQHRWQRSGRSFEHYQPSLTGICGNQSTPYHFNTTIPTRVQKHNRI